MNRIQELFRHKNDHILSVYFSAGYPRLNDTVNIIQLLEKDGADMIEIGIPFSDPMADGPVIQKSNDIALHNGMSLKLLFEQLKDIRKSVSIPLILMGYINPILQFGVEKFCKECAQIGIDGTIFPDLPMEMYREEYQDIFEKYNMYNIFLVTPQTSKTRLKQYDAISKGFIYMVSTSSTTGKEGVFAQSTEDYFKRIRQMGLKNPRLVGFGIHNNETFEAACKYSQGAIIGSAFIKALSNGNGLEETIKSFIHTIRNK